MRRLTRRRIKKIVISLLALIILGVLFVVVVNWRIVASTRDQIHSLESLPGKHSVGLVLGARVYANGNMPAVTRDRVMTAVELYQAGKIKKILMSGDNREHTYDEVTTMRNFAIGQGVPADDVVRDFAGFRTYDSIYRARELWDLNDLVVITQEYHLFRAIWIANKLGMNATGVMADKHEYKYINQMKTREALARLGAWADVYVLNRKPYFLGPKEGLSGRAQDAQQKSRNPGEP